MSLTTWFLQRRLRKELGLSKKEYGMFKTMFVNNWFSTLGGIVLAAMDAYKHGVDWRQALIIGVGCIMRDGVPGIKTGGGGE